jgi:hypothetical protein
MPLTGMASSQSMRRRNIRKSQSDVGMSMSTMQNDHLYLERIDFCQTAEPKLKRHYSEQTATEYNHEFDDDDDDGGDEYRKRNKENNDEVPRVNRAQTEGWLRVRNHVVR